MGKAEKSMKMDDVVDPQDCVRKMKTHASNLAKAGVKLLQVTQGEDDISKVKDVLYSCRNVMRVMEMGTEELDGIELPEVVEKIPLLARQVIRHEEQLKTAVANYTDAAVMNDLGGTAATKKTLGEARSVMFATFMRALS